MSFAEIAALISAIVAFLSKWGPLGSAIISNVLRGLVAAGRLTQAQSDEIMAVVNLLLGAPTPPVLSATAGTPTEAEFRAMAKL